MLTALMLSMVVNCAKADFPRRPPPQVTVACEGGDQVRRDLLGRELSRWRGGCLPRPVPAPVKLTAQPGWKFGLKAI